MNTPTQDVILQNLTVFYNWQTFFSSFKQTNIYNAQEKEIEMFFFRDKKNSLKEEEKIGAKNCWMNTKKLQQKNWYKV